MLNQFHKNNLKEQWEIDLANEFPEFFPDPSEEVLELWESILIGGGKLNT